MSQPKPPTPNPGKDLKNATKVYLKFLPQMLQAEADARAKYDPQRVREQLDLQKQFGPEMYDQQLAALNQLDPQGVAIRKQLGSTITGNLTSANAGVLPPGLAEAWNSMARASEVAHGNTTGGAPAAFEDIFKANNLLNYQQQQIQNAGNFISLPTPEQQLTLVQPVTPDRASAYVNPSAPSQAAQNSYQNTLAAWQLSQGRGGGWGGALSGAASGALTGASIPGAGYYGAAIGGVLGGVGGYFSDARLKNHIEHVGRSPKGHPIYEFNYDDVPDQRFRGTIAQELLATCPEACTLGDDGYWRVNYDKTDIKLEQIQEVMA